MDIYDLAVKLSLINGVSGGLTKVINQFTNLRVNIRNTQNVLQSFEATLAASFEWRAGKRIVRGMGDIIAAGGALLDQQTLMLAAGWRQADVAQMTAAAYREAASVMAATPASALQAERTLLGIFGNVREAQAGLVAFLQTEAVMTAAGRGAGAERQLAYGLKALDLQGAFVRNGQFSVSAYQAGMHELVALMLAIPHTLDMNQLMLFTRMAGPAAQAMSFADYARTYGEVIASMGRTDGRGLQMLYKTFLGGNVSKALADELIRAGLVKPGAIRHIKGSSRDILDYHGIMGWQELTTNAADWAHDVLFPTLATHGFKGVPGMMQAVGSLPVTVQRLLSFLLTNWAQVERGRETIERAERTDSYKETAANSWSLNVKNFEAARGGLMQALGVAGGPTAISLMKAMTAAIKGLTRFFEDHPDIAYEVDVFGVALGMLLAVRGLRTASVALRGLGLALPTLARGRAGFAIGEDAAVGLGALSSGLPELGIVIAALWFGLRPILHEMEKNDSLHRAEPEKRISDAMVRARAEGEWRMTHGSSLAGFHWTPPPVPPMYRVAYAKAHPGAFPLPLPPIPPWLPPGRQPLQVSVSSPVTVTLPLPPMSPADLRSALQMALIQGIDRNTLAKLADMIAREQVTALQPLLDQVVQRALREDLPKHQQHQNRRTFLDHGRLLGFGGL